MELPVVDLFHLCAWTLTQNFMWVYVQESRLLWPELGLVVIGPNPTQQSSGRGWRLRLKCSYESCDGPVHCLLCLISLVPYLIVCKFSFFWVNKKLFFKCVVLIVFVKIFMCFFAVGASSFILETGLCEVMRMWCCTPLCVQCQSGSFTSPSHSFRGSWLVTCLDPLPTDALTHKSGKPG